MCKKWIKLKTNIESVTETVLPRHFFNESSTSIEYTLHVVMNIITNAYGAVANLCCGSDSALVMSTKIVASLKELTPPHLELMVAVLGARLVNHLRLTLDYINITLW